MYEKLLQEALHHGVDVYEKPMVPTVKGLYGDNVIWVNKHIPTSVEKTCVLAEELGHHLTTVGNILDQTIVANRKQELRARRWAYEKLVPLASLIDAFKAGVTNQYELAEFLGVTESFLVQALKYYQSKYGLTKRVNQYTIQFEPLLILELCE